MLPGLGPAGTAWKGPCRPLACEGHKGEEGVLTRREPRECQCTGNGDQIGAVPMRGRSRKRSVDQFVEGTNKRGEICRLLRKRK